MGREIGGVTAGFRSLLGRLMTFKVDWRFESDGPYEVGDDRVEAPLTEANVVSSALRSHWLRPKPRETTNPFDEDLLEPQRHVVALDIDYPAYLIPSHTADHFHLYLDVPGGVAHEDYMELLDVLGRIGIIEPGYAEVSRLRGHTDLRLPWVAKEERPARPTPRCCRCLKEATELNEYRMATWGEKGEGAPEPTDDEVIAYVWKNEGTINRRSGLFACTACYIAMGQPSGPQGWTPSGPDSIQLL